MSLLLLYTEVFRNLLLVPSGVASSCSYPNRPGQAQLRSLAWLDTAGLNGLVMHLLD